MRIQVDRELLAKTGSKVVFAYCYGFKADEKAALLLAEDLRLAQGEFRGLLGENYREHAIFADYDRVFGQLGISGAQVSLKNLADLIIGRGDELKSVSSFVDLYNSFSLRQLIPCGAYDLDRLGEEVYLGFAEGMEEFWQLGKTDTQVCEQGDVILRDERAVMCRHWVWRQSEKTKVRDYSRNFLLRFELLGHEEEVALAEIERFLTKLKTQFGAETGYFVLSEAENSCEFELSKQVVEARKLHLLNQDLLCRGVSQVNVYEDLEKRLYLGEKLRIKFGIDPTGSDLTLGHAVALRKLKKFQEAGHTVVLLFGTFTAQIGDPTGKSQTRTMLTKEQVLLNVETYLTQAAQILDPASLEIRYNHEWLEPLDFSGVLSLAGNFTVAQMLERDMFQERIKAGREINLVEFMYPLMQGYDSVPLRADVEIGGTDQLFNMMCARPIQKAHGLLPQNVMTVPILVGTDGKEKMSKSLGNYIALNDSAVDMFGKTMSIRDESLVDYFELATDLSFAEIAEIKRDLASGVNPRDLKLRLAEAITALYHGPDAVLAAREHFLRVFSEREVPLDIPVFSLGKEQIELIELLLLLKFANTKGEARRLIEGGGVKIDEEKIADLAYVVALDRERLLKAGKRNFAKVVK
jgi:tyrosyl-tRNA synthetase